MKRILVVVMLFFALFSFAKERTRVIVAYVTSGGKAMPDPTKMTHINYAFGHVNATFDGVEVQNPNRLHQIVGLKKVNPRLRVMLSIGGWTSGGFSEMARDEKRRSAFVASCKGVVDEFGLDGIDMDWEYPSSSESGIVSSPCDVDNFTILMRQLRRALGHGKLLTFASIARADYVDFPSVVPYVDFINIMAYDLGAPSLYHHSALFPSERTRYTGSEAIQAHVASGVPPSKLVLGVPFYGHSDTTKNHPYFVSYNLRARFEGMEERWDDVSQVPYLVDSLGEMVYCFDNERSLTAKVSYARSKRLLGVMYWQYDDDDSQGPLRDAIYYSVFPKKEKIKR